MKENIDRKLVELESMFDSIINEMKKLPKGRERNIEIMKVNEKENEMFKKLADLTK